MPKYTGQSQSLYVESRSLRHRQQLFSRVKFLSFFFDNYCTTLNVSHLDAEERKKRDKICYVCKQQHLQIQSTVSRTERHVEVALKGQC